MVSINTNISSLNICNNLTSVTDKLEQSIERLSTGFKINHASDNAANYSISNEMTKKISAYDVAEENTSMGMDMVATANNTLSELQTHAERLMALCIQARNGTYNKDSLAAIQSEANARIAEVSRLYSSTEYNDISLLDKVSTVLKQKGLDTVAQNAGLTSDITASKGANGKFIDDIVEVTPNVIVTDPTQLASAISSKTKIGIANAETLAKLAELVNSGTSCNGKTIILTEDIDLSAYQSGTGWTPIGNSYSKKFQGTFNGNGHVISNLYINNTTADYQGLFGYANGTLKNIGIENCEVNGGTNVGGLVGYGGNITNSYATGNVCGTGDWVGGLVGWTNRAITNSYATGNVSGTSHYVGGLVAYTQDTITNSYATGNVCGTGGWVGGLVGSIYGGNINNSVSFAQKVTGTGKVGSFVGYFSKTGTTVTDCNCVNISGVEKTGKGTEAQNNGITAIDFSTTLQVGINGDDSSKITTNTTLSYSLISRLKSITSSGIESDSAYDAIQEFIDGLNSQSTELGATQNRLDSALESIAISYDNLVSSRSTLRDTDMAEESSRYVQKQILQEANATLLATANQNPQVVLKLIYGV